MHVPTHSLSLCDSKRSSPLALLSRPLSAPGNPVRRHIVHAEQDGALGLCSYCRTSSVCIWKADASVAGGDVYIEAHKPLLRCELMLSHGPRYRLIAFEQLLEQVRVNKRLLLPHSHSASHYSTFCHPIDLQALNSFSTCFPLAYSATAQATVRHFAYISNVHALLASLARIISLQNELKAA